MAERERKKDAWVPDATSSSGSSDSDACEEPETGEEEREGGEEETEQQKEKRRYAGYVAVKQAKRSGHECRTRHQGFFLQ